MYYYFRFHKFLDNFFFWPWKIFKFCFDKTQIISMNLMCYLKHAAISVYKRYYASRNNEQWSDRLARLYSQSIAHLLDEPST